MKVADVLDQAKAANGFRSDNQLALALKTSRASVSNWRHGQHTPDEVMCEKLAVFSGIPLHRVLGIVGEARAVSPDAKRVWRKLAAAIFVSILLTPQAFASETLTPYLEAGSPDIGGIMRKVRRTWHQLRIALATLARRIGGDHEASPMLA